MQLMKRLFKGQWKKKYMHKTWHKLSIDFKFPSCCCYVARKVIQIIFPFFILVVASIYQISPIVRTKIEFDEIA